MNTIVKWLLIGFGLLIFFTGFTKIMTELSNLDIVKIVLTAMFNGIGTALGIYIGGNHIIDRLFNRKKNNEDKEKK
jgi:hypothetical protein